MATRPRGWRKVAIASWRHPNDPTSYGILEIDATALLAYLERLKAEGQRVTVLSLVVKAAARAMASEPAAMHRISFGRLIPRESLDIFVQVDRDRGADLSGLKIMDVPAKSLTELASEVEGRARSARSEESAEAVRKSTRVTDRIPGFLMPLALWFQDRIANDFLWDLPFLGVHPDPFGAAMVTNVGSLGALELGLPPIPPICRCVMVCAVGKVREKPWVVEGRVVARPVLTLGIAVDHRYLDGAHASRMANVFAGALQDPEGAFGARGERA